MCVCVCVSTVFVLQNANATKAHVLEDGVWRTVHMWPNFLDLQEMYRVLPEEPRSRCSSRLHRHGLFGVL